MTMRRMFRRSVGCLICAALLVAGAAGHAQETRTIVTQSNVVTVQQAASEYWLGIAGQPVSEVLKAQLKLDQGIVVENVIEESPAAKAGLKPHDILLQFGGQDVPNLAKLTELVEANKEKEVEVALLRAGERTSLKITPEKRPESARLPEDPASQQVLQGWARNLLKTPQGEDIVVWRVAPGMMLPGMAPGEWAVAHLPPNTKLTITKDSSGPAQIEVQQGEQTWSVTSETLDELPEELRGPVRQMLEGRHMGAAGIAFPGPHVLPRLPGAAAAHAQQHRAFIAREGGEQLGKKLDALLEKVDALQKAVDELKKE